MVPTERMTFSDHHLLALIPFLQIPWFEQIFDTTRTSHPLKHHAFFIHYPAFSSIYIQLRYHDLALVWALPFLQSFSFLNLYSIIPKLNLILPIPAASRYLKIGGKEYTTVLTAVTLYSWLQSSMAPFCLSILLCFYVFLVKFSLK